jgi:hypothetical protein
VSIAEPLVVSLNEPLSLLTIKKNYEKKPSETSEPLETPGLNYSSLLFRHSSSTFYPTLLLLVGVPWLAGFTNGKGTAGKEHPP